MRSQVRVRIELEWRNQLLLCRWKLSTVSVRIYLYQHIRSTAHYGNWELSDWWEKGNWIAADTIIIDGKQFYLMEHQAYRDQAQGVILDAYGKMVVEECKKFDEKTKQKIYDYILQQVPLNLVEQLKQDGKIRL